MQGNIKSYDLSAKEHGDPSYFGLFFFIILCLYLNTDVLHGIQHMKFYLRLGSQHTVQEEQTGQNGVFPEEYRHKCYPNSQAVSLINNVIGNN